MQLVHAHGSPCPKSVWVAVGPGSVDRAGPRGKEKVSQESETLSMLGSLWVGGEVVVDIAQSMGILAQTQWLTCSPCAWLSRRLWQSMKTSSQSTSNPHSSSKTSPKRSGSVR